MLSWSARSSRSARTSAQWSRRSYAIRPDIPILPPSRALRSKEDDYAVPPMLPPDMVSGLNSAGPGRQVNTTRPVAVNNTTIPSGHIPSPPPAPPGPPPSSKATMSLPPQDPIPPPPKQTHRLRNALLFTTILGALTFAGGVYASLENDTVYEIFTEMVPYGEEAVLYMQEREFRNSYPQAQSHVAKAHPRSTADNVYIPQSGAVSTLR